MMTSTAILLLLSCSATAHLVMGCVMALYARHRVQYLALAWINGIFGFALVSAACFSHKIAHGQPGLMHPLMLLVLVASCYLQSIYPLGITMPAFLQWRRMWKYARPAIALIFIYLLTLLLGNKIIMLNTVSDVLQHLISGDVLLRLSALGISLYYIANIFQLPRQMAQHSDVPRYLLGYCTVLGAEVVYFTCMTVLYGPVLLTIFITLFTLLNMYLSLRTLETMALHLPKPVLQKVTEEPTPEVVEKAEREDFNEANLQRFQRIQYWMQHHREEWTDYTFGRDRLCEAVGYNRHLTLQSIRSQGFNNVHDYINSFRIEELKRLILTGEVTTIGETSRAGFGATKTARTCFQKMEGQDLDEYMAQHKPNGRCAGCVPPDSSV